MRSISAVAFGVLCAAAILAGGCATGGRLPAVPLSLAGSAPPLNIPDARYDPDTDIEKMSALATQAYDHAKASGQLPSDGKPISRPFLAISGGGDEGGFRRGSSCGLDRAR